MNYFQSILMLTILLGCTQSDQGRKNLSYASVHELKRAVPFAPEIISTTNGICFSKLGDTLYTSSNLTKRFDNDRFYAGIFESHYKNGQWTSPKQLQFDIPIDAYHPVLSIDNQALYFNSRSHLDSANKSVPHDIWMAQKTESGWSTPEPIPVINSAAYDSYPSIARNRNLYFNSDRDGGLGSMDFYVSYFVNGKYQPPTNLEAINSSDVENDLVVDPDERFIIFNRYIMATGKIDLYISFKKDGLWGKPRLLDNINTEEAWELTPSLSPDGKYFFYELNNQIMQMDLSHLIYTDELSSIGKRLKPEHR